MSTPLTEPLPCLPPCTSTGCVSTTMETPMIPKSKLPMLLTFRPSWGAGAGLFSISSCCQCTSFSSGDAPPLARSPATGPVPVQVPVLVPVSAPAFVQLPLQARLAPVPAPVALICGRGMRLSRLHLWGNSIYTRVDGESSRDK